MSLCVRGGGRGGEGRGVSVRKRVEEECDECVHQTGYTSKC